VCWEKLFNYFEIEPRYVNLTEDCFVAPPEKIAAAADENTIGVVAILGTTYSGHFEDVAGIDAAIGKCVLLFQSFRSRVLLFEI
jgi:glutamate decarboxylase